LMIIKYCSKCKNDVAHSITIVGNVQIDRCLACGFESSFDYYKVRELIREIESRLKKTAEIRHQRTIEM